MRAAFVVIAFVLGCASTPPSTSPESEAPAPPNDADCRRNNPHLPQAKASFDELKYDEAERFLQRAIEYPGNCQEVLIEIYLLKAYVDAIKGEKERCLRNIEIVRGLDPSHVFPSDLPPKIQACIDGY